MAVQNQVGKAAFTRFLKQVESLHGENSVAFIKTLGRLEEALPQKASLADRRFLLEVMLHPSMAWIAKMSLDRKDPSRSLLDVMKKIAQWYFDHPAGAREADTLWSLKDRDSVDTDYDRAYRPLSAERGRSRKDPKEVFAGLLSKKKSAVEAVPVLVRSICAEEIRRRWMPKGLDRKEKEAYTHLTRTFLPDGENPLGDYEAYVQYVATNIHIIARLKQAERSVYRVGAEGYASIQTRLEKAMRGPHDLPTYNAVMRAELAQTLTGEQRDAFLELTDPKKWGDLFRDPGKTNSYLFLIHGIIETVVTDRHDNTGYNWNDLERIWRIVTGAETPRDIYSNFVSRLVHQDEARRARSDQPGPERRQGALPYSHGRPAVPKRVVQRIISDVNFLRQREFAGPAALTEERQRELCDTVYPWVSDRDPAFIHGFIRGLLALYASRVSCEEQAGEVFEAMVGELRDDGVLERLAAVAGVIEEETDDLEAELFEAPGGRDRFTSLREYQGRICVALLPWLAGSDTEFFRGVVRDLMAPRVARMRQAEVRNSAWVFEGMLARLKSFNDLLPEARAGFKLFSRNESNEPLSQVIQGLRARAAETREPKRERPADATSPSESERESLRKVFGVERVPCERGDDSFFEALGRVTERGMAGVRQDLTDSFTLIRGKFHLDPENVKVLDPVVGGMLDGFGFFLNRAPQGPCQESLWDYYFWERWLQIKFDIQHVRYKRSAKDPSLPGKPGGLELVPILAQIYRRRIGVVWSRKLDGRRRQQWMVCNVDWETGESLGRREDPTLVLLFDGEHWDATRRITTRDDSDIHNELDSDKDDDNNHNTVFDNEDHR